MANGVLTNGKTKQAGQIKKIINHKQDSAKLQPLHYLPTRFSYISEVGEMVLYPVIDFLQSHLLIFLAVDRKLDHGHIGVRRSFRHRALNCTHAFLRVLCLKEKTGVPIKVNLEIYAAKRRLKPPSC